MTLSWPSFLAAAISASRPPRSATLVAVAAELVDAALSFSGGEQAAIAAIVVAARVTVRVRVRAVRTVFLLLRHRLVRAGWIMKVLGGAQTTVRRPGGDIPPLIWQPA